MYNLIEDPLERESVVQLYPNVVKRGREYTNEHLRRSLQIEKKYSLQTTDKLKVDNETLRKLKSMGYLK